MQQRETMSERDDFIKSDRWLLPILTLAIIGFLIMNFARMPNFGFLDTLKAMFLDNFTVILISILLEAIPFVLLGALVSSLIQTFISEEIIARFIPKSRILGLIAASLMGFIFPVCECAIVPIMRRLMKKGVPIHIAITFMLAVPIANPIVLLSTYYAFSGDFYIVFLRGFLGILGAITIGHFAGRIAGGVSPLKDESEAVSCQCGFEHEYEHEHIHAPEVVQIVDFGSVTRQLTESIIQPVKKNRFIKSKETFHQVIAHTSHEFYDVGKFLIIGATLSALMQTVVPRESILTIGQGSVGSVLVMMTMAFVLSLCSEADAFIARTFMSQFTTGSIIGFMIFGPMLDIKNTMMLSGVMKPKFLVKLILVIIVVCFTFAMLVNLVGL